MNATTSSIAANASKEDRAYNPKTILQHYRELSHPDIHKAFARMKTELTPDEQQELICLMLFFAANELRKAGNFLQLLSDKIVMVQMDENPNSTPSSQQN